MSTPPHAIGVHEHLTELHADAHTLDLGDVPDSADEASDATLRRRGAKRERMHEVDDDTESLASGAGALSGGAESARREHHNKHTRKCRARLKSKFDAVLDMLPPAPPSREVKHKVQVLEYAMHEFRALDSQLRGLEWALALHSHRQLLQWVSSFASVHSELSAALSPFIDLFCHKFGFVYAETWRLDGAHCFVERFAVCDAPWCTATQLEILSRAGDRFVRSKHMIHVDTPIVHSALTKLRPQLEHPNPPHAESDEDVRSRVLAEAGIATTLLVPVTVCADVVRFVAFHDIRERPVDEETRRMAAVIATSVGNAYNAAQHERNIRSEQLGSRANAAHSRATRS